MFNLVLFAAVALQDAPLPDPAARLLTAVEAGQLAAARAALAPDVLITIQQGADEASDSNLEAFVQFVRGCRRTGAVSEPDAEDPSRVSITVDWTCSSRPAARAYIWADDSRVVDIQFGPATD